MFADALSWFNVKILCYKYRNSHYKDKMVSWPSYLYNGIPCTWKDGLCIEMGHWLLALTVQLLASFLPRGKIKFISVGELYQMQVPLQIHISSAIWYHRISLLLQVMAWRPTSDKPLSEPMLTYCRFQWNCNQNICSFFHIRKCCLPNVGGFVWASMCEYVGDKIFLHLLIIITGFFADVECHVLGSSKDDVPCSIQIFTYRLTTCLGY